MKVTKLIREYVEGRVHDVYQPAIEIAEKAAATAKDATKADFLSVKEALTKEGEKLAKEASERFAQLAAALDIPVSASSYRPDANFFTFSFTYCSSKADELSAKANALRAERSAKVRDILVSLELGATKADLERTLSNIKVG